MGLTIEQLVNTNYVRYERMNQIVNEAFVGSNANTINVYIDMYSMIKVLYVNKIYDINDYTSVTSCLINMCAHYRDFFRTRYRTESNFYIVYSKNTPYINNQFYLNYNMKSKYMFESNKVVDDMIKNNIELLETLCPYLPDIHFIKGTYETGVIIYDLICRNEAINNNPHLVITKDIYNYQLVSTRDNIIILRPKKVKGEDVSYYINNNNLYKTYLQSRKVEYTNFPCTISPRLLSLLMTLSSVKERDIKSLLNIRVASKVINEAVNDFKLVNGYNSPEVLYPALFEKINIGDTTLEHRFKAIDILFQHNVYLNTPECIETNISNLYDPDNVKIINNKYFKSNPLDLNRL